MIRKLDKASCLIKSVDKVRRERDIHIEKIVLTRPDYYTLLCEPNPIFYGYRGMNRPITIPEGPSALNGAMGTIMGVSLELGEKSEIVGKNPLFHYRFREVDNDFPVLWAEQGPRIYTDPITGNRGPAPFSEPINFNIVDISMPQVMIKSRAQLFEAHSKNEWVALDSLREMISETDIRKYLKYGFVLVRGASGDTYQIFRSGSHTKVWRGGKVVEEICVRIRDLSVPQTDNVIAFKTMIEADEEEFKKLGNVYKMDKRAA